MKKGVHTKKESGWRGTKWGTHSLDWMLGKAFWGSDMLKSEWREEASLRNSFLGSVNIQWKATTQDWVRAHEDKKVGQCDWRRRIGNQMKSDSRQVMLIQSLFCLFPKSDGRLCIVKVLDRICSRSKMIKTIFWMITLAIGHRMECGGWCYGRIPGDKSQ